MLALDANILIRAVLGSRVLFLLRKYAERARFVAPDTAYEEAREWLPEILEKRRVPIAPAMVALDLLARLVRAVEVEAYEPSEEVARQRIALRDEDDWPIVATALALDCPIWTEDTDRIELYLDDISTHEIRLIATPAACSNPSLPASDGERLCLSPGTPRLPRCW